MNTERKGKENKTKNSQAKKPKQPQSNTQISTFSQKKQFQSKMKVKAILQLLKQNLTKISSNKNLLFIKAINANLSKFNITQEAYHVKIINDIIFDENKRIVSVFKNNLVWDETSDFLKRFYFKAESMSRIPKIAAYYQKFSIYAPVYFNLTCCRLMVKNTKRKKKRLEADEEKEGEESKDKGRVNEFILNEDKRNVSYFIKPEEVNEDFSKSQSQLSYFIKKIDENDQFHYVRKKAEGENNDFDKEISLSQYVNTSRLNNQNLNDIVNDLSFKSSKDKQNGHFDSQKKVTNIKKVSKTSKGKIVMHKLNIEMANYNTRQGLSTNSQCRTERITPSKGRTYNETKKRNHKLLPKAKTIEITNENDENAHRKLPPKKKPVCLDVIQLMNIPKPQIEAKSNKNDSESQMKYRKLVLDIGNKLNRSNKSPFDALRTFQRNFIFSNDSNSRKNTKQFVKLPFNAKRIKSSTVSKKVHIKKYHTKPSINHQAEEAKRTTATSTNFFSTQANSYSTTPTGYFIPHSNQNQSSNALTTNIKVNLTNLCPKTNLITQRTTPLTASEKNSSEQNYSVPYEYERHINKTLKINRQLKRVKNERSEGKNNQKNSRNNKTLFQTNFQSTSSKKQGYANHNAPQKPAALYNSTNTLHETQNNTLSINKQKKLVENNRK